VKYEKVNDYVIKLVDEKWVAERRGLNMFSANTREEVIAWAKHN